MRAAWLAWAAPSLAFTVGCSNDASFLKTPTELCEQALEDPAFGGDGEIVIVGESGIAAFCTIELPLGSPALVTLGSPCELVALTLSSGTWSYDSAQTEELCSKPDAGP